METKKVFGLWSAVFLGIGSMVGLVYLCFLAKRL